MVRDAKTILAFMRSTDMQKGEPTCRVGRPRCKKQFCISDSHPCMSASYYHVLPQNVVFASRTATLACRPSYSILLFYYFTPDTVLPRPMFRVGRPRCKKTFLHLGQPPLHVGPPILLFYYFTISLQIQYCRGRCLGLAARDAKKFSTYYHVLPHILPHTTAERSFCISDSHPCMSALLFYYFTILLFYCFTPDTVLPRPMFRVGRPRCTKRNCISDSHFCMSALLFYYFTMLPFYYFTPDTVLPRPMFGVGCPRCKKVCHVVPRSTTYYHILLRTATYYHVLPRPRTTTYYHVLQQNVVFASRTATLACRPSYSILLFYYFTILLFYYFTPDTVLPRPMFGIGRPRCKKFRTYYHVLQQNVVFASRTATLACRPSCSAILLLYLFYYCTPDTVLPRPMFRVGRPRCKKTFLHFGQPPLYVGPPILLFY